MSAIKRFMEDVYDKYNDGISVEDIAKFYNVEEAFIQEAIDLMDKTYNDIEES